MEQLVGEADPPPFLFLPLFSGVRGIKVLGSSFGPCEGALGWTTVVLAALPILEPVLVLLAVWHGRAG